MTHKIYETVPEKESSGRSPTASKSSTHTETVGTTRNLQLIGNRAIQCLLAQRASEQSYPLDDETIRRVNRERGRGQKLDDRAAEHVGSALGYDFSGVTVHTSREADELNKQLGARAFTTGQDVLFRQAAYHLGSGD